MAKYCALTLDWPYLTPAGQCLSLLEQPCKERVLLGNPVRVARVVGDRRTPPGSQHPPSQGDADRYRDLLIARYGEQAGRAVQYAEAFEGCEYGAPLTKQNIERLFPF
jgi:hypothetical protein